MNENTMAELVRQLTIKNQLDILKSLYKVQYIEGDEFAERVVELYNQTR